jgi:hypothetical protein
MKYEVLDLGQIRDVYLPSPTLFSRIAYSLKIARAGLGSEPGIFWFSHLVFHQRGSPLLLIHGIEHTI